MVVGQKMLVCQYERSTSLQLQGLSQPFESLRCGLGPSVYP